MLRKYSVGEVIQPTDSEKEEIEKAAQYATIEGEEVPEEDTTEE